VEARFFQQAACPFDIRPHKRGGIQNGPIDVGFSGKVHDRIKRVLFEQCSNSTAIGNVSTDKSISRIACNFIEVSQIARVRKQVEIDDGGVFVSREKVTNEAGTDKPGASSNQNLHCFRRIEADAWIAA
jgi:hypothetical protein